jgi:hypothetical protein
VQEGSGSQNSGSHLALNVNNADCSRIRAIKKIVVEGEDFRRIFALQIGRRVSEIRKCALLLLLLLEPSRQNMESGFPRNIATFLPDYTASRSGEP